MNIERVAGMKCHGDDRSKFFRTGSAMNDASILSYVPNDWSPLLNAAARLAWRNKDSNSKKPLPQSASR